MKLFTDGDISGILKDEEYVQIIRDSYKRAYSSGGREEVATIKYDKPGSHRLLAHVIQEGDFCAVKWTPSIPGQIPRANPVIVLNDFRTGKPLAIFDAGRISAYRTAATTRYVFEDCCPAELKKEFQLLLIGKGPIAEAHKKFFPECSDVVTFDTSNSVPLHLPVNLVNTVLVVAVTEETIYPFIRFQVVDVLFFMADLCRYAVDALVHAQFQNTFFDVDGASGGVGVPLGLMIAPAKRTLFRSWGRGLSDLAICVELYKRLV